MVWYFRHGRSRTSRCLTSSIFVQRPPHPEHTRTLFPRFRRTHNFSVRAFSSISCRYTRYPGQSRIVVNSRSVKRASLTHPFTFLRRATNKRYAERVLCVSVGVAALVRIAHMFRLTVKFSLSTFTLSDMFL